jgi:hypothetical protein
MLEVLLAQVLTDPYQPPRRPPGVTTAVTFPPLPPTAGILPV